jgi:hypothetical protein
MFTRIPILALKKKFSLQNQTGKKIQAKPLQNWTKTWQRSKTTYFHPTVDKVERFLKGDDCGDDR